MIVRFNAHMIIQRRSQAAHHNTESTSFDMVRLSKSKDIVDLAPNTIRKLHREAGLNFYRLGKAVLFSRSELADLIRQNAAPQIQ